MIYSDFQAPIAHQDGNQQKNHKLHQLDLLERNVIDDDEYKQRKTKKMLDFLMLKLIHEDFINKTYSVASRSKMRPELGKYLEATREERTKKLKLFAKQRNVKFID